MTNLEKAKKYLIDETGTFSKRPCAFIEGSYPTHINESTAPITTVGGVEYIDWIGALGANNVPNGIAGSLPYVEEVDLAEKLAAILPVDRFKFLKTGSGACQAAIRYARAHTGRGTVLGIGYHGWHNAFIAEEDPGLGCVGEGYRKLNNLDELLSAVNALQVGNDVAAVILEPVILDVTVRPALEELRAATRERGVLMILDEIVSGTRVPQYSFSGWWDLQPDIMTLGKPLAGGASLSVVGVTNTIRTDGVFVSTTFAGEREPLRRAIAYLDLITPAMLDDLWQIANLLRETFNTLHPGVQLEGYTRMQFTGDKELIDKFWERMVQKGHLLGKCFFIGLQHQEYHIMQFIEDARACLDGIEQYTLQGKPSRPAFKR